MCMYSMYCELSRHVLLFFPCLGSAPPAVLKAKPDEFIHIFVNNSAKLREFLEHMIKVVCSMNK